MTEHPAASKVEPNEPPRQPERTAQTPPKWFHFRGRVLLVIPGALLVLAALYVPRQLAQQKALVALKAKVTDAGLAHLSRFRSLGILSLNNTAISDEGLAHLAKLPKLERLYLDGTGISDAGLAHLSELVSL